MAIQFPNKPLSGRIGGRNGLDIRRKTEQWSFIETPYSAASQLACLNQAYPCIGGVGRCF
jgi:hypothetical protein